MNRTGDEPAATVVVLAGRVDLDAAAAEDQTYPTVTVVATCPGQNGQGACIPAPASPGDTISGRRPARSDTSRPGRYWYWDVLMRDEFGRRIGAAS